jgi:hypothetical protein
MACKGLKSKQNLLKEMIMFHDEYIINEKKCDHCVLTHLHLKKTEAGKMFMFSMLFSLFK